VRWSILIGIDVQPTQDRRLICKLTWHSFADQSRQLEQGVRLRSLLASSLADGVIEAENVDVAGQLKRRGLSISARAFQVKRGLSISTQSAFVYSGLRLEIVPYD
jgi:hypothetical protein